MKRFFLFSILFMLISPMALGCVGNVVEDESKKSVQEEEISPHTHDSQKVVEVGKPAPDFELENLNGDKNSLQDFRGGVIILAFWETWCPSCRQELMHLNELAGRHAGDDLTVVAINTMTRDKAEVIGGFMEDNNLDLPVLLDQDKDVASKYMIQWLPTLYIIDSQGIVRFEYFGIMDMDLLEEEIRNINED